MSITRFLDADGVDIAYRRWDAASPRGVVVIAHGASEHSGRYARFAQALGRAGWTVLAPDHRGHGETADSTCRGIIGARAMNGVLDDLQEIVARAGANGAPVVLFGHSLGSAVALRYAETRGGIVALALSGPIGAMPGTKEMITQLQAAVDAGIGDQPMDALAPFNTSFEPARTPFDWLSRDDAEVDAYIADPMAGDDVPLTYGWVLATFTAVHDGAAEVAKLPPGLPVLVAAGEQDPVSNFTANARELAAVMRDSGSAVTENYYPGARHEILNETNRDQVTADIIGWLESLGL